VLRAGTSGNGDTVVYTLPWAASDTVAVEIQPQSGAARLPDGLDNTTDEYRILFEVPRNQNGAVLRFSLPTIINTQSGPQAQLVPAIQDAEAAAAGYGIRSAFGMEFVGNDPDLTASPWYAVSGAGRHVPTYLPTAVDPAFFSVTGSTLRKYTAAVSAQGGLTSIAHPFGTSGDPPKTSPEQNLGKVDSLGAFLVSHGAWGADLVEVGTIFRGGVGLREHLWLLDYLVASGIRICGDGVTDSHGGRLLPDPSMATEERWNFVTWIGHVTRASSMEDIITAMRACDVSFGNPFYARGGMWADLRLEPDGTRLALDVAGVTPSARLFLYEAEIDSTGQGHRPIYRQYGAPVEPSMTPAVGGCRAGFARVEAWVDARPIAFSNVVRISGDSTKCAPQGVPPPSAASPY